MPLFCGDTYFRRFQFFCLVLLIAGPGINCLTCHCDKSTFSTRQVLKKVLDHPKKFTPKLPNSVGLTGACTRNAGTCGMGEGSDESRVNICVAIYIERLKDAGAQWFQDCANIKKTDIKEAKCHSFQNSSFGFSTGHVSGYVQLCDSHTCNEAKPSQCISSYTDPISTSHCHMLSVTVPLVCGILHWVLMRSKIAFYHD